jgi:biotin carboxylase
MARRRVLVLNLGWEQLPLIRELERRERDLELFGVHDNAATVPRADLHEVLVASMRELERIVDFADRIRPHAVVSDADDYACVAQAVVAERHGLPGPKLAAAQRGANKLLQRQAVQAAGIRQPEFALCLSPEDVNAFAERHGWPLILKPVDNRGSIGVSRVDNAADVKAAFLLALANAHSRLVLVERFVMGEHLTIEGYCFSGKPTVLSIGENRKFGGALGVVNEAIRFPASLPARRYEEVVQANTATADALGYRFGHFHGESIIEARTGDLYFTEMANRGGGVHISNIAVPFVCGLDVVRRYVDDVLGEKSPTEAVPKSEDRSALLHFFAVQGFAGRRLRAAHGLEAMSHRQGVLACRLFVPPGGKFGGGEDGARRQGMVIVGGSGNQDLESVARAAEAGLDIEVEREAPA